MDDEEQWLGLRLYLVHALSVERLTAIKATRSFCPAQVEGRWRIKAETSPSPHDTNELNSKGFRSIREAIQIGIFVTSKVKIYEFLDVKSNGFFVDVRVIVTGPEKFRLLFLVFKCDRNQNRRIRLEIDREKLVLDSSGLAVRTMKKELDLLNDKTKQR